MKTTMDIADPLFRKAKRAAAERGITFKQLVEEALRGMLEKRAGQPSEPFRLHTFRGNGLQPGLDWSDFPKILEMIYEDRGA